VEIVGGLDELYVVVIMSGIGMFVWWYTVQMCVCVVEMMAMASEFLGRVDVQKLRSVYARGGRMTSGGLGRRRARAGT